MSIERAITRRLHESKVGAFYIIGGKIASNDVPVRDGESYGDFVNYSSHWDLWKAIQRVHPELRKYDYADFPRGRIVYNKKENKYIMYLDPKLKKTEYINLIKSRYNLRAGSYHFGNDEHYSSRLSPADFTMKENIVFTKHLSEYVETDTI